MYLISGVNVELFILTKMAKFTKNIEKQVIEYVRIFGILMADISSEH